MITPSDKRSEFRKLISDHLAARAALFRTVTSNTTISGAGHELALGELFRNLIPRRYEVLTGTILPGAGVATGNAQVDLIFSDTHNYPVLVREGNLAAVLTASVAVIIEVKAKLDGDALWDGMQTLQRASRLTPDDQPPVYRIIYGYQQPKQVITLRTNLEDRLAKARGAGWRVRDLPDLIISGDGVRAILTKDAYELDEFGREDVTPYLLQRVLSRLVGGFAEAGTDRIAPDWAPFLDYVGESPSGTTPTRIEINFDQPESPELNEKDVDT